MARKRGGLLSGDTCRHNIGIQVIFGVVVSGLVGTWNTKPTAFVVAWLLVRESLDVVSDH
jgi:hypothetical protein